METRYAAGYREAEPCAARFRRARRIDAVETLEDPLCVLGRYADAVVFNRNGKTARRARNRDGDIWRTRVAYRVRDEVANRLANQPRVDLRDAGHFRRCERQGDSRGLGLGSHQIDALPRKVDEISLGKIKCLPFALEPREIENLLDEGVEPRRLL